MKALKILLIFTFFFSHRISAQENFKPLYVSNWGYLYKNPDVKSERLGIFATEASVIVLDSIKNFYQIKVNNGDTGFITKQKLQNSMSGNVSPNEPKEYFYRGEYTNQCPHMYVQVSGLRARSAPNTNSKIVGILPINSLICVEYIPLYENGWVYMGDHFHKKPEYVQCRFLGKEISFEKVLADYESAEPSKTEERKILIERLVEIGWNSKPENILKALKLFKSFHEKQGTLTTVPDIDFHLFLAENIQNPLSPEERLNFEYTTTVLIQDKELEDGRITEKQAISLGYTKLVDLSKLPDSPECGWEPIFAYLNKQEDYVIYFEEINGKIMGTFERLVCKEGNGIIINGFKIDENISEQDFIRKFGKVINFNLFYSPGEYYLPSGDAGFVTITFKNRKAISYRLVFYC